MNKTTRTLNPLPFHDLEPHRFEDLVRQLIYDFRPWRMLEPTGRLGADDGYDARGFEITSNESNATTDKEEEEEEIENTTLSHDRLWQIQCKREKTITPEKLKKYIEEMIPNGADIPHGVIFAAPCDFSKATHDVFREKMIKKGVKEFYLWGKAHLEDELVQPKNDNLLYAYFGISLIIRRRTMASKIRGLLAIKRKAVKHLGGINGQSHVDILLRDINDTEYPYSGNIKNFKTSPPWKKAIFIGHYHKGIKILTEKFYAYRELDGVKLKAWDFTEEVNLAEPHEDPWAEKKEEPGLDNSRFRGHMYWSKKVERENRAYFEHIKYIPYERIIEIDGLGDNIAECPHVFIDKKEDRFADKYGRAYLSGEDSWGYRIELTNEDKKTRKKIFPKKFPVVKEDPLPPVDSQKSSHKMKN